jgi:hypothetical protein
MVCHAQILQMGFSPFFVAQSVVYCHNIYFSFHMKAVSDNMMSLYMQFFFLKNLAVQDRAALFPLYGFVHYYENTFVETYKEHYNQS